MIKILDKMDDMTIKEGERVDLNDYFEYMDEIEMGTKKLSLRL